MRKLQAILFAACAALAIFTVSCSAEEVAAGNYDQMTDTLPVQAAVTSTGATELPPEDPRWVEAYPYLRKSLHLMGMEANDVKDVLGEPESGGTDSNHRARYIGDMDSVYDSKVYSWILPTKKDLESYNALHPRAIQREVNIRVAVGGSSKKVEAVKAWWIYIDAPMFPDLLKEMGLDAAKGEPYWWENYHGSYYIALVYNEKGISTVVTGMYNGEFLLEKRETNLETGQSEADTTVSPEFSFEKVQATSVYIGPANIDPFDPYGRKPQYGGPFPGIGEGR